MFGVSVDDLFGAFPVIVGIFGSGWYTAWRTLPDASGTAPNYTPGRRVFALIFFGAVVFAAIIIYLVHAQLHDGTILSVQTALFAIFSVLMGVFYTWLNRRFAAKPKQST